MNVNQDLSQITVRPQYLLFEVLCKKKKHFSCSPLLDFIIPFRSILLWYFLVWFEVKIIEGAFP